MSQQNKHYSKDDLSYMASLSAAVLEKAPVKSKMILWIMLVVIAWLIIWASFAEVDELARGVGKVIPSKQVQVVQNLEGGIVSEILVDEGEKVDAGQILVKIDDTSFSSSYEENRLRYVELKAKSIRLEAEASGKPFKVDKKTKAEMTDLILQEQSLYYINKKQLGKKVNILKEQVSQRENELREAQAKEKQLETTYKLIAKEVEITKPLVKSGLVSQVEYLQLSREATATKGELDAVSLSIPRIRSTIAEAKDKMEETKLEFQHKAKEELTKVTAEMSRILESGQALEDRVNRTLVRSPVKGVVKQLLINTINGVVQPGMDIVEIVPIQDKLLIETKIKPSDIAYLFPGQKAIVKFTAYDFAIYGGLTGKVTHISADTIVDEEGNNYYLVRIKTDTNFLERHGEKFEILVGMVANVDIVTGKKTVMDYILKPILKAQQGALRER
ncbi:MAG: HlyD family type I secretion periplasmic adaptor subunit [Sulfurimonadaceae bacterium]|nr:HlyD family type I secretion periplasmic adaptor subunit [Sulfurimonadaceae bacterium]